MFIFKSNRTIFIHLRLTHLNSILLDDKNPSFHMQDKV